MAIDSRQLGGTIIRKSVTITSSQTWIAPANMAGNTAWLTGCAGGGSGAENGHLSSNDAFGGCGGCYVENLPIQVVPSTGYTVVIPAGGVGVTIGDGNAGGDLTFGSILTIKGGSGGKDIDISNGSAIASSIGSLRGIKPFIIAYNEGQSRIDFLHVAESVNGNICGNSATRNDGVATGGAAGYFGNGANSVSSGSSTSAPAAPTNSGAGGGCVYGASVSTSGAGGSGKLIIEWDEYL